MTWRLARSIPVYIGQINAMAPNRSKASDGTIGDAAHQATNSDHNPKDFPGWGEDIVTAVDITHDPGNGCDMGKVAESLRHSRDSRIKYFIFNRRLFSSYSTSSRVAWAWGTYTGVNPHEHHGHLSVVGSVVSDSTAAWSIGVGMTRDEELVVLQAANIVIWNLREWLEGLIRHEGADDEAKRLQLEEIKALIGHSNAQISDAQIDRFVEAVTEKLLTDPRNTLSELDRAAIGAVAREAFIDVLESITVGGNNV